MTVLLVALMDWMSNASCCFCALSHVWLCSVADVSVGTMCPAVWLNESEDLFVFK